ncbi:acyl-CoA dehydrogenase family protein [Nocardioides acrostichi]|uniref:Acyl-CoA dehydrogenase n=1 Tax=Nocardioides acrostichi TaxID=2784339 RepID=A0A930V3Z6_9ACTN|nr:acyl-CoA dehydrogenase family protein [Nocardioides acrostichi]MBF4163290.1 acyl-CoA dehydrogenase [Nocardioides acrostichi]
MSDHLLEIEDLVLDVVSRSDSGQAGPAQPSAVGEHGLDASSWKVLCDLGLVSLALPESLGGSGGGLREAAAVVRAGALLPMPLADAAMLAAPLLAAGSLPWPGGVVTATIAGVELDVRVEGEHLCLSGPLRRVPWLRDSDHVVVSVAGEAGTGGLVAVLASPASDDLEQGRNLAGEPRDTWHLEAVRATAWAPAPDLGPDEVRRLAGLARASQIAGAASAVLSRTLDYTRERIQFGRPLAALQAVQQRTALVAGEVTRARVVTDAAAAALDAEDSRAALLCAVAACEASSSVREVAAAGHQLHGAMGWTTEYPLGRATTRLWSWRDEYGDETAWAQVVAETVAAGPDVWTVITGSDEPEQEGRAT